MPFSNHRMTHSKLLKTASFASLAVAITLVLAKAIGWWISGSVSLLAGLTDSLLDSAASLLNLLAVYYSLQPADDDHRYGHGKAEALAGLGQSMLIGVSAILVAFQAWKRLSMPQPLDAAALSIAVMVFSLVMTLLLVVFQQYVINRTHSTAIRADSLHYRSDILLNLAILMALILTHYGWPRSDPLFGLGIAGYILWSALQIVRESVSILMDKELPKDVSEKIHLLACNIQGVLGAHDVRTRVSGSHWFVQMHLELPGELTLSQAHVLCDRVERAIKTQYPQANVLIHADPQEVVGTKKRIDKEP